MDLNVWMKKNRWTQAALCREVGCTRPYMCRLIKGQIPVGKRLAQDISEFTKGEVTYFDIVTMYKPKENVKCG